MTVNGHEVPAEAPDRDKSAVLTGSPAVTGNSPRPEALRPRHSTGLPFSVTRTIAGVQWQASPCLHLAGGVSGQGDWGIRAARRSGARLSSFARRRLTLWPGAPPSKMLFHAVDVAREKLDNRPGVVLVKAMHPAANSQKKAKTANLS